MGIVLWVEQSLVLAVMSCTAVWNLEFPRGSGGQNIWSTGSLCHSADSPPPPCSLPPAPRPVPGTGHWPMSGENLRKWSQEKLRAYCCFTFVKSEKVDSVVQVGTLRTETGHMTLSLPCPWVLVNYHKLKWPLVLNRGLSFYQAPDISKRREGQCWFASLHFRDPHRGSVKDIAFSLVHLTREFITQDSRPTQIFFPEGTSESQRIPGTLSS